MYRVLYTVIFLFILLFPSSSSAVSIEVTNPQTEITDQPFDLHVKIQGAQSGTNYLRANLYPPGTTNYFGFTYNGTQFYNGADFNQYFPLTIGSDGTFEGTLQAKLDPESNYFKGPGTYNLKVRRYTQSGSSYTWSNETNLTVNYASASATPSATPSPTPNPSPTHPPSSQKASGSTNTFSISADRLSVNSGDNLKIAVTITGLTPDKKYFTKGAFIKPEGSNYFGKTLVSDSWVKNSQTFSSQHPLTSDSSGNYNGTITVSPDPQDNGFTGTGTYILKAGIYTQEGSGPTWSNQLNIEITENLQQQSSTPKPSVKNMTNTQTPSAKQATTAGIASQSGYFTGSREDIKPSNTNHIRWWLITAGLVTIAGGVSVIFLIKRYGG